MKKILVYFSIILLLSNLFSFTILGFKINDENYENSNIDQIKDKILIINDKKIGNVKVDFYEHEINGFKIKNDYILVYNNLVDNEHINTDIQWRNLDNYLIDFQLEEISVENNYWAQKIVFLEPNDLGYFYTLTADQSFPLSCWEVRYKDGLTKLYDENKNVIGYGIPTPSKGFSLSGLAEWQGPNPDFDSWKEHRENAHKWFKKWTTNSVSRFSPKHSLVSSKLSDENLDYFYEIAHSPSSETIDSSRFLLSWAGDDSWYKASDINVALSDRTALKFAFIGSCEGMTETGEGTLSYAFRKGQITNTVTIGYTHMSSSHGWSDSIPWQDLMFEKMNEGLSIKMAFDVACSQYPNIEPNVVFVGDTNLKASKEIKERNLDLSSIISQKISLINDILPRIIKLDRFINKLT